MFMGTPENYKLLEIVGALKSWIPKRGQPANMPRDFWMPDQSCRVCYECDSPFTVFNRRHHCRLCGRVFCAKCASNSIPVPSEVANIGPEDGEKIRVCNYCFKQQKQGIAMVDNATSMKSPGISPSPSTASLASTQSSCTCNSGSSVDSTVYSTGSYLHVPYGSCQSPSPSAQTSQVTVKQDQLLSSENPYSEKYDSSNRNNDEDYDYSAYKVHSNPSHFCTADVYYDDVNCNEETLVCHHSQEKVGMDCVSSEMLPESIERKHLGSTEKVEEMVDANNNSMEYEDPSTDSVNSTESEPVDFENNGLLWLPPEPEDEEDEREALLDDDDDNGGEGGSAGEWGYLSPSCSFADGEFRNREKSTEEHKRVIKHIVDGHFKALIGQLLKAENLSIGDEDDKESWLEIITALSWEAATFLKPDMSQSEGMDPGAYVKVKCIPCGHFTESVVVKGVVCKKNVAHRRMTSKIDKPRLLILGGALEYQRVANHLSSFDTLLQQEKDHLMMAVAKIDAHHPNILLVEKSVSRFAQEYLLAKDISLVLNVKRPLLQRIARCTGAKIVPSVDNLATQKLGYCDSFRVEKFVEEHGKAGHDGRKLVKTLMFFEGCPKPLGCTILLKGANVDELKKVKHVVQYGVFAAYHLALETSFLADEGASLPDLPLKSPIKVPLPDKPSSINRSITLIPGFTLPVDRSPQGSHTASMSPKSIAASSSNIASDCDQESYLSKGSSPKLNSGSRLDNLKLTDSTTSLGYPRFDFHDQGYEGKNKDVNKNVPETSSFHNTEVVGHGDLTSNSPSNLESLEQLGGFPHFVGTLQPVNTCTSELVPPETDNNHIEELEPLKEEFTHLPSVPQSILVSLSTRCVWKGTVCERSRLFRIKYYGSFDLPLGRFLRDHLFDQNYRCHSCEMPSEAHVHCYTHQQGSLTISVKKLPNLVLPGEREGKIWMWHRCMQCPRINGFPPATRRVVMSDAARGLSFGKFLELSFSNHAAASRVAGCGHSLHKDCLRFYGFGKRIACFRYAPINVHSVFLPPQKLEFNHDNQEWIHKEVNEVCSRAESLFVEVFKALHKISEQISVKDGAKAQDSGHRIAKLERLLEREKKEFEELLGKVLNGEVKADVPSVDVLEVNRLKRQLVLLAYLWDQRLVHITSPDHKDFQSLSNSSPKVKEKPSNSTDSPAERNEISCPGKGFNSSGSFLQNAKSDIAFNEGGCGQPLDGHKRMHMDQNQSHMKELDVCRSSSTNISDQSNQEPGKNVKRVHSEEQSPVMENLSDTLDAAWTGEGQSVSKDSSTSPMDSSSSIKTPTASGVLQSDDVDYQTWLMAPFLSFYQSFHNNFRNSQKQGNLSEYNPVYILSFRELLHQGGARLLLPVGVNDTVVPVYDDEPTSVIAYALVSTDYHIQMSDASERTHKVESPVSLPFLDSFSLLSLSSFDEVISESLRGVGSIDESTLYSLGSHSSSSLDQHLYTNVLQARITFSDDGPRGKVKYAVTCYYAKQFEALRKAACSSELDFVRSLSRCKKWGAQGGKSNVFFAKTLDDRFIIKQVTKTELESFIKFAPAYFKYLSDAIASKSPTCLAKILGIYQVTSKHLKGGKESKMDVLVMENLLFKRNITRLYDLKGSCRSRYNPDSSGSNKVLLDQNLIESMPTSPIFLGPKAKRLLERAVWNDTAFLASIDVMDYSLLAGVDEEKHELVLGIIDFMRQYTWDKHLETWVKASGILGGPKNASPTVISPEQYKKRFRKAMAAYFLMVPDRWSSSATVSVPSQSNNSSEGNSLTGESE